VKQSQPNNAAGTAERKLSEAKKAETATALALLMSQ
jgi:hypothetical protein